VLWRDDQANQSGLGLVPHDRPRWSQTALKSGLMPSITQCVRIRQNSEGLRWLSHRRRDLFRRDVRSRRYSNGEGFLCARVLGTLPSQDVTVLSLLNDSLLERMLNTPTVFVVDDDPSVRTAVERLLMSVGLPCETFASAPEFLQRAEMGLNGCLVLDVRMPGPSGLDLQRMLVSSGNDIPIIFVTAHADVPLTVRAMKEGALEVLTKPFDDQAFLDLVNSALKTAGQRHQHRVKLEHLRSRYETLTPREREVMALVVTGMLNKQIAGELGTTEKTVKVHRSQVMRKMEADSVAALVRMADVLGTMEARP
jgi:FixJ family two-component response regulator